MNEKARIKTVLLHARRDDLRCLVDSVAPKLARAINFDADDRSFLLCFEESLRAVRDAGASKLEALLVRMSVFNKDAPMNSIVPLLGANDASVQEFNSLLSPVDAAFWLYFNHGEIFEKASVIFAAEERFFNADRARFLLPRPVSFKIRPIEIRDALAETVAEHFPQALAGGRKKSFLISDSRRRRRKVEGDPMVQLSCYIEKRPSAALGFDECDQLSPVLHRDVIATDFLYNQDRGIIDLVAPANQRVQKKLVFAFASAFLDEHIPFSDITHRSFRLNALRRREPINIRPDSMIQSVKVTDMTIQNCAGRLIKISGDGGYFIAGAQASEDLGRKNGNHCDLLRFGNELSAVRLEVSLKSVGIASSRENSLVYVDLKKAGSRVGFSPCLDDEREAIDRFLIDANVFEAPGADFGGLEWTANTFSSSRRSLAA